MTESALVGRARSSWRDGLQAEPMRGITPYLLLCILTAFAHFLHVRGFGLYEDDYHYIGQYLDADLRDVVRLAARAVVEWPQGRPLQSIVPPLLTAIAFPIGGLPLLYLIACGITAGTVVLFYRLALRITGLPLAATIGSVMFALFPPDTTHPFLMHAFVLRLALLFALAASVSYLDRRRRISSYVLAFASLTLYETPMLIFLGIPLLRLADAAPGAWRELIRHLAVCGVLIGFTLIIRLSNAEERVLGAGTDPGELVMKLPVQMLTGALTTIKQMSYGPVRRIGGWDPHSDLLLVIAIPLFYLWLRSARGWFAAAQPAPCMPLAPEGLDGPDARFALYRLLAASGAWLLAAYLLSFTHTAWFTYGRLTSVHLAASVPGSLLFTAFAYALLNAARRPLLNRCAFGFLALHFAVLLGYRHTIQVDFVRSWQTQRWYWSNVLARTPDRTDGTLILVAGNDMPTTRYINSYSWFDPLMITLLFRIPETWRDPPLALPLFQEAQPEIRQGIPGVFFAPRPAWYSLTPGNVILLTRQGRGLLRDGGETASFRGVQFRLRQPGAKNHAALATRPLYELLIDPRLVPD